jgi:hypothetical protein
MTRRILEEAAKSNPRHTDQRSDGAETGPPEITFNLPLLLTEGQHEEFCDKVNPGLSVGIEGTDTKQALANPAPFFS